MNEVEGDVRLTSCCGRLIRLVCLIAVATTVAGFSFADEFSEELQFLDTKDVKVVGREGLLSGYEDLLSSHPSHPDRAAVMVRIASRWELENHDLEIRPDREQSIRWLEKAAEAAPEASKEWFEARFRLVNRVRDAKPAVAQRLLKEVLDKAPNGVIETKAKYELQMMAVLRGDYKAAEEICLELQRWYDIPGRVPIDFREKGQLDFNIQDSALSMMTAWADMNVPMHEREKKIDEFVSEFGNRGYIQTANRQVREYMSRVRAEVGESEEALPVQCSE
jgi:hypothetical protein